MEPNPQTKAPRTKRWKLVLLCAALITAGGAWWGLKEGRPKLYTDKANKNQTQWQ